MSLQCCFCGIKIEATDRTTKDSPNFFNISDVSKLIRLYVPTFWEKISRNNSVSKEICLKCLLQFEEFHRFIERAYQVNKYLRNVEMELKKAGVDTPDTSVRDCWEKLSHCPNIKIEPVKDVQDVIEVTADDELIEMLNDSDDEMVEHVDDIKTEAKVDKSDWIEIEFDMGSFNDDYNETMDGSTDSNINDNDPEDLITIEEESRIKEEEESPPEEQKSPQDKERKEFMGNGIKTIKLNNPACFLCGDCNASFKSIDGLKEHTKSCDTECYRKNLLCKICQKTFTQRRLLRAHLIVHRPRQHFGCGDCGKVYSNRFNLENHIQLIHLSAGPIVSDKSVFTCEICTQSFKVYNDLTEHIANHHNEMSTLCPVCGKSFQSKRHLSAHLTTHSEKRPFKCEYCSKQFRTRTLWFHHQHVHTGIKAYECELCEKTFVKRESLMHHIKVNHADYIVQLT